MRLDYLVRNLRAASQDGVLVDILLERANHLPAADGARECSRLLTDAEVDHLLACDERGGAA